MLYPLVSVVIPCYNHEKFVQDTIQSVIDQTYSSIELIIIDDGSSDGSVLKILEMVKSCEKRFVRFKFTSRLNKGLSATLNEGLEWCEGKYISTVASDDLILKNKTKIQVEFLEKNKEVVAVFGGFTLIDKQGLPLSDHKGSGSFYNFKDIILLDSKLPAPTQMIRATSITEVGGYDSDIKIEDWYMWLKLSLVGSLYAMEDIVSSYRRHSNNSSSQLTEMHSSRMHILKQYKNSKYYEKSIKRLMWLNASEEFYYNDKNKAVSYVKMLSYDPLRTINRTLNKILHR